MTKLTPPGDDIKNSNEQRILLWMLTNFRYIHPFYTYFTFAEANVKIRIRSFLIYILNFCEDLQINLVDPVPIERRKYQGKVVSEQITQ